MRKLIELIALNDEAVNVSKSHHSVEKSGSRQSKTDRLIAAIRKGDVSDDFSACMLLYNDAQMASSSTYNSLKMRLFHRLKDQLLEIDWENSFKSELTRSEFAIRRDSVILRLLQMKSCASSAAFLARKNYSIAEKFQLSLEASIFAEVIASDEALTGRTAGFEDYKKKSIWYLERYVVERRSRTNIERVMSWYSSRWSFRKDDIQVIENYINDVTMWSKQYGTHSLLLDMFRLTRVKAEMLQDYITLVQLVDQVENYYMQNPIFRSRKVLGAFNNSALAANIWLERYDAAEQIVTKCTTLLDVGSVTWFSFKEYHIILEFRTFNFENAERIFTKVATRILDFGSTDLIREKWRLFEFYLRFMLKRAPSRSLLPPSVLGAKSTSIRSKNTSTRFHDFANCFPTITKDLSGYGITAVFAQILYFLHTAQYDALIERDESLQTYRRKRIKGVHYRLTLFSKLIHEMVRCDFDYTKTQKRCTPLLLALSKAPVKMGDGTPETLELVPLEDVWAVMMEELKAKNL